MAILHMTVYLDPASHLLMGARFNQDTQQGKVESVEVWSDFHDVHGVKFPFHSVTYRAGTKFSETPVKDMKLNTNPDPRCSSNLKSRSAAARNYFNSFETSKECWAGSTPAERDAIDFIALAFIQAISLGGRGDDRRRHLAAAARRAGAAYPRRMPPAKSRPAAAQAQATPSPFLAAMSAELDRSLPILGKADPPAYFISYTVTEGRHAMCTGSNGALLDSSQALSLSCKRKCAWVATISITRTRSAGRNRRFSRARARRYRRK